MGKQYVRRKPWSEIRWQLTSITTLPIGWSAEMAYIVGLTATDGCLGSKRRSLNFKSADRELVATYLRLLGRTNKIGSASTKAGGVVYYAQFSDTRLYRWFQEIGLTPRKSLTLGAIDVPDEHLAQLVRGLLDGDGTVSNAVSLADTSRRSDYYYEWLRTRFASASRPHLDWLKERLRAQLGLSGWIIAEHARPNSTCWRLSYGKRDSIVLLSWLYADARAPRLERKYAIWADYAKRHGLLGAATVGPASTEPPAATLNAGE